MSEIEKTAKTTTEQLSVLAGGGVDEIADINKGNEVNCGEFENVSQCESDDLTIVEKKKTQSSELNSEYARKRREFERRAELDRVREETRISTLIEFTGGVNPYTNQTIKDKLDVEKYLAMLEIERNGGNPLTDYLGRFSLEENNSQGSVNGKNNESLNRLVKKDEKDGKSLILANEDSQENQTNLNLEKSNNLGGFGNVENSSNMQSEDGEVLSNNELIDDKMQDGLSVDNNDLENLYQTDNSQDEVEGVWFESDRVDFFASHPEITEDNLKELFQDEQFILYGDGKFGVVPLSEIYEGYKNLVQVMEERAKMVAKKLLSNNLSSPGALGGNELTYNKTWENMSAKEFELEIQKAKNGGYRAL